MALDLVVLPIFAHAATALLSNLPVPQLRPPFGPIGGAPAWQLAELSEAGWQFGFIGNENGETLLDGETDGTACADELLLVASQKCRANRIKGTTELGEEGVVHGLYCSIRLIGPIGLLGPLGEQQS
jgi:hypothetical protein